jgi:hypothetical protein
MKQYSDHHVKLHINKAYLQYVCICKEWDKVDLALALWPSWSTVLHIYNNSQLMQKYTNIL